MVNDNNIKANHRDKKISIALMSSYVILTIQYVILVYFNLLNTSTASIIQFVSLILVGIAFLYALPTVVKRNKIILLMTYFIISFIFIINFSFYPENREYLIELIFPVFFMSLPAFIYALSIKDMSVFKNIMKKSSNVVFFFGLFLAILIFSGNVTVDSYSMALSYYILLPSIIYLDEFIDKFSVKALILVLLSIIIILALGSRGAILCIIVFTILKLLGSISDINYKRLSLYLIVLGTILLTFLNSQNILSYLNDFFYGFGISSRSINLFLLEDISLTGRDNLYGIVIEEIKDNPFIGIGLGGDNRVLLEYSYVHNIFIEILGNFGLIIGPIIIILLLFMILKCLISKDPINHNMIIIWFGLGFVHLIVSSSYLTDIKFWIFAGLVLRIYNEKTIDISNKGYDVENKKDVINGENCNNNTLSKIRRY